jgi:hypothetical protein
LDIFEKVYYTRAVLGVIAGVIAGLIIPVEFDQVAAVGTVMLLAIVFYFISYGVGKSIAKNVPKEKRRKVATDGIVPFIFMLFAFMIMVYTALHQSILIN